MTCTVLPVVGTLAGVVIGALLTPYVTSRWQHRQWMLDNTRAEYRELLGVLSKSAHYVALSLPVPISVLTPDQQRQIFEADAEARRVIADRILIAQRIRREDIAHRWTMLMAEKDFSKFWNEMDRLHDTIVKMAHEDLGLKWGFQTLEEFQALPRHDGEKRN